MKRLQPLVLLLGLLMPACAPAAPAPTVTPSPVPPTATHVPPTRTPIPPTASLFDVEQFVGAYTVEIGPDEIASATDLAEHERCENMGTFRYEFAADGRWTMQQTPHATCGALRWPTANGTWEVLGDEVVIDDPKSAGCPARYIYRIKSLSDQLQFSRVEDDCSPRTVVFTALPWTRVPALADASSTAVPTAIPTADFAPSAIVGIWTRSDPERGQLYLTFMASGRYIAAHGEPSSGVHGGRYTLEGRVLTFVDGWRDCKTGSYVLTVTPAKALTMRVLADRGGDCDRVNAINLRRWTWVQP